MKHTSTLMLALALTALFLRQPAKGAPMPAQNNEANYINPVWPHDFPDPFVLQYRGKFYAYATETSGCHGFQCMESKDLVHWKWLGSAFQPPWSPAHYWAPEVDRYQGKFYMVYSALNPQTNKHDIGIAIASQPAGPFHQAAILVHTGPDNSGSIDADLYFQKNGVPWLLYSRENPRSIVIQQLDKDLMHTIGEPIELVHPDRPWENGVNEAPTLIKHGSRYVLFFSAGVYESDNKADASYCVCWAESRNLLGPYTKAPGTLLHSIPGKVYSPGHQCVIKLKDGSMWMLYHGWDNEGEPHYGGNPLGRTLRLDQIHWKNNEPIMAGASTTPQPAPHVGPAVHKR